MNVTNMRTLNKLFLSVALLVFSSRCFGQEIEVAAAKKGGVYDIGEKIVWRVTVKGEGAAGVEKIGYVVRMGDRTEMSRGDLTLKEGGDELTAQLNEAGTVLAEFTPIWV